MPKMHSLESLKNGHKSDTQLFDFLEKQCGSRVSYARASVRKYCVQYVLDMNIGIGMNHPLLFRGMHQQI